MKALWNRKVIAQSDNTILIESNHYFPKGSVNKEFLMKSDFHTVCPWKGLANYYSPNIDGKVNEDAAWYYSTPKDTAIEAVGKNFSDYIAFWKGVVIVNG